MKSSIKYFSDEDLSRFVKMRNHGLLSPAFKNDVKKSEQPRKHEKEEEKPNPNGFGR